jgi:guanylate kinase
LPLSGLSLFKELSRSKSRSVSSTIAIRYDGQCGIGKNTIIGKVMELDPGRFAFSASRTTRAPREGEVDGVNYNFVTREDFERDHAEGKLLEHALVHGNYYGTSFEAFDAGTKVSRFNKDTFMGAV